MTNLFNRQSTKLKLSLIIITLLSFACNRGDDNNNQNIIFEAPVWDVYTVNNSDLPHNFIRATFVDSQNTLWIGTSGRGLFKQEDGDWIKQIDVRSSSIDGISENDNNIWVATNGGGIYKQEGNNWINYNSNNSDILHNNIFDIHFSGDNIFVGSEQGLSMGDGATWQTLFDSDADLELHHNVYSVLEDSETNLWVGTFEGLGKFDGNWSFYSSTVSNIKSNIINDIYESTDGTIYFGTRWGVSKYSKSTDDFTDVFEVVSQDLYKAVICIFESSDSKLWIGTRENGFYTYNDGVVRHYTPSNSQLPNYDVYSISEADDGGMWIGTGGGLVFIPFDQAVDI